MNTKDFADQFNKIKDRLGKDKDMLQNKLLPEMEKIRKEFSIIETPKRKKNEKFGDNDIIISQLSDGRIIIRFETLDESDKFYSNFPIWTLEEYTDLGNYFVKRERDTFKDYEGKIQLEKENIRKSENKWKEKSLFERIFKK